jgi:Asp-tRNA(Asn)/Glu-tRNA(Gln) amidotransferase A subunit family amidase
MTPDRRTFTLAALATAGAGYFGSAAALRAQAPASPAGTQPSTATIPPVPPLPLGNAEPPASQFQPFPGGTGALLESLVRERGVAAFARSPLLPHGWTGTVPDSDDDLAFLPAHRLSALLRARKITATRLTEVYLARLRRLNPTLNCVVTLLESQALAEAGKADAEIGAGRYRGPLHGLPYGLKDLFAVKGTPTTWGVPDFKDRVIDEDAEIVVRLREAGAVLVAKLSTGIFAQNDQWFGGRTNNPWNLSQGSSGSSAGPASAVAAGCVAFAIGTETQGSIVSPAIRCGITALRPTFGRVSRYGGMVLAWSQDRVGPMCRSAEDCAMVFSVIHGVDPKDPSTITTPFRFDRRVSLSRLRVGIDPDAPAALVARLKDLGVQPREIGPRPTVPGIGQGSLSVEYAAAFDDYVTRKAKETGLDLSALPDTPIPTPPASATNPMAPADWNPRFVNGRRVRGFDYLQLQRRRHVLVTKWGEFMKDLDMFIGAPSADVAANAQTGHPCVVLPYAFDVPPARQGAGRPGAAAEPPQALAAQPVCATIVGALYADDLILGVAHRVQDGTDFHRRRPSLS